MKRYNKPRIIQVVIGQPNRTIILDVNLKKHPNQEIDSAIDYAVENGWEVKDAGSSSHAWGRLKCPHNDSECRCGKFCLKSIWSTPKNLQNHAKQIRRIVDGCINKGISIAR